MKDMTTGNPLRQILIFAFPLLLANLCQQCYHIADTFVVGRYLGKEALGAVGGASGVLLFMTISMFLGLANGMPVMTGQCFGAKDYINVRRSIALSLVVTGCISLPVMIAAGFTTEPVLRLMNTPENLIDGASYYMKILYFCGVSNVLLLQLTASVRALGDSRTPLYFMIFSCALNILLNFLFVACFEWGIPGVAWATVTAQIIPTICFFFYFRWKMPQFFPRFCDFNWTWSFVNAHLRIALPAGFQHVITAAGFAMVQRAVNSCGEDAVSGISASAPINALIYMPLFAINAALATFCSQNYGAQNLRRIIVGVRRSAALVLIYTIAASAVMLVFAPGIASAVLPDTEVNRTAIGYGVRFLRILAAFYPVLGGLFLFSPALQGMGFPRYPFISGIMEFVIRFAGALLLTRWLGFDGACLSTPLAWFAATSVVAFDYIRKIRMLRREGITVRIERATETV